MATNVKQQQEEEEEEEEAVQRQPLPLPPPRERYRGLISTLPSFRLDKFPFAYRKYGNIWHPEPFVPGTIAFGRDFTPRDSDILLASPPKSGTAWLKALTFAVLNRALHRPSSASHPLTRAHPQSCIPFVHELFSDVDPSTLDALPSPRLLATHLPSSLLPELASCRIVYVCREPKDTLASGWHYFNKMVVDGAEPFTVEEYFEHFVEGLFTFGPIWDHQLGYWRERARRPEGVLFLKYEDLVRDGVGSVERLAEFLGCGFSEEEARGGVAEEIVRLCSIEKMKMSKEVVEGSHGIGEVVVKNSSSFRRGVVGDWRSLLDDSMAERLDAVTEEKLRGSGLSFW